MSKAYNEITPLTSNDCFVVFSRDKSKFTFPLHYHEEFELNFIENAGGTKRIVGNSIELIDDLELVLVGSNVPHGWFDTEATAFQDVREITIQFHKDLFDEKFLNRDQMSLIRSMLERSRNGISFPKATIKNIRNSLELLSQKKGFHSVIEFVSILHELSLSKNTKILSSMTLADEDMTYESKRMEKVMNYLKANYEHKITLEEVTEVMNMTKISFSRFIRKRSGKTFTEFLNDIRLSHASRLLIDTQQTIAEVSYKCGYNNLSYFNRTFKRKHKITPKEFREAYAGSRTFV
jgi:AraC-like DNA-binding protein